MTLTSPGLVVGTLPYIAPERLRGVQSDARSDLFSFGAVLYEMVTGQKTFAAKSQADLIVAVIEHEPPSLATSQSNIAPAIERIIRRCLVKDPEERWQTARDLAQELRWIRVPELRPAPGPALSRRRSVWRNAAIAAVAPAAFAGGLFWHLLQSAPPSSWTGAILGGPSIALGPRISPDGKMLAIQAMVNGLTQVAMMKPESGTGWCSRTAVGAGR
jgi:eukaryotic-like serine/threonine-protein kinase